MAIFGWLVLLCITLFAWKQSWNLFRFSMAFTGKPTGEFYAVVVIAILLSLVAWYTLPFKVIAV